MAVSISISITQNSQSVANNTSNVTVKVNASWTNGSYNQLQKSGWLKIDDTKYDFTSSFNYNATSSGSQTLFTKTVNVVHGSDGAKTLSCSASYTSGVSSGTVTASASKKLTTIPRKSSLNVSNGTLGTGQTLTVTRQSNAFTHTITYKCGNATGTVCTKSSDTSISWTPPLSLAAQNTTGTSVSIGFTITTYNGSTSVGSNTKTISCSIPSSVRPTVSIAVSDSAGYSSKYGAYVKGKSRLKITITASGNQGSTVKSYSTTADGKTYSGSSVTTSALTGTGTLTVTTTVTDSRNRTATASTTISVLNYSAPKITSISAWRCVSLTDSTASESGAYMAIACSSSTTSLNNKNSATYTCSHKKISESEYTSQTSSVWQNTHSASPTFIFEADTSATYDIVVTVTDDFGSGSRAVAGGSTKKLFSILRKGKGLALGKVAELADHFDVAFKSWFRKDIYMDNNVKIYGTKVDGTLVNAFQAQNENGNTVIGWDNYNNKSGNTNIYGHEINFGVSNLGQEVVFRPYYSQGDTITQEIKTAGYVTNSGKDVSFTIPLSKPPIDVPKVTVTSGNGFTLRQGNAYTHGSGASTTVFPDSYTASVAVQGNRVTVTAHFSNTTNVTNNDAIGIYWHGTITF